LRDAYETVRDRHAFVAAMRLITDK
jgi:hypothetical protein